MKHSETPVISHFQWANQGHQLFFCRICWAFFFFLIFVLLPKDLNTGETLYDIDFDEKDPNHGFIVGARALFYETKDGGNRWVSRSFANLGKGEDISDSTKS